MKTTPLENKISTMVEPIITDLGFNLVWVRITGDNGAALVQITAEDPATRKLGVDDCAKISRAVSAMMDVEDPIKGAYRLEVSSPGIDRLLTKKKDFEDFAGFEAKIETLFPSENGQKRFKGVLKGIKQENILVQTETGDVEIPYADLAKAKLVLTDELIKATANF